MSLIMNEICYSLVDLLTEKKLISKTQLKLKIFKRVFVPMKSVNKLYAFLKAMHNNMNEGIIILPALALIKIFEYFLVSVYSKDCVMEHYKEASRRPELRPPLFKHLIQRESQLLLDSKPKLIFKKEINRSVLVQKVIIHDIKKYVKQRFGIFDFSKYTFTNENTPYEKSPEDIYVVIYKREYIINDEYLINGGEYIINNNDGKFIIYDGELHEKIL